MLDGCFVGFVREMLPTRLVLHAVAYSQYHKDYILY